MPAQPQFVNALGAAVIAEEEWVKAPSGQPLAVLAQKTKWTPEEEDGKI